MFKAFILVSGSKSPAFDFEWIIPVAPLCGVSAIKLVVTVCPRLNIVQDFMENSIHQFRNITVAFEINHHFTVEDTGVFTVTVVP